MHFLSFFQTEDGTKFMTYLNAFRVEKSCRLLQETDEPVIEIGYVIGFNNLHSFNDAFKKNKGMTPGEYRKFSRKGK